MPTFSGGSGSGGGVGASILIYRYTVAGVDKASIDTGADTPDAGANNWASGDMIEALLTVRTDDAGATGLTFWTVNNDSGANYDQQEQYGNNVTNSAAPSLAQTKWLLSVHGSGGGASYSSAVRVLLPDYIGTAFFKAGLSEMSIADATAGNNYVLRDALAWRSTAAISRLKVACNGAAKLKVGTQLAIYKRLSA